MREIFGCFLLQGHFLSPSPGAEEAEAVFQVIFWDTVITSFSKVYQESTQDASQTPRPISQGQRPKELTLSTNTFKQKHTFTQDKKKKKKWSRGFVFSGTGTRLAFNPRMNVSAGVNGILSALPSNRADKQVLLSGNRYQRQPSSRQRRPDTNKHQPLSAVSHTSFTVCI